MAVHIENLNIESFRGIRGLALENLNHVNIIAGDNNSGKTSVLEALMFLCAPLDFFSAMHIARIRDVNNRFFAGASHYEKFINLFPRNADQLVISINSICENKPVSFELIGEQTRMLLTPDEMFQNHNSVARKRLVEQYLDGFEVSAFKGELHSNFGEYREKQNVEFHNHSKTIGRTTRRKIYLNTVYLSPIGHMCGNIFDSIMGDDKYKEICINVLRLFDPQISDLLYLKNEMTDRPVEYIKHETLGNMPISTYGDGIKKVLSLANGIAQAANGVLLIDELETAIHVKYYDDIFRFIVKACKQFQVQLFVTTHSMEAIDKLLATQEYENQDNDDITVITFKKDPDCSHTLSRTLSGRRVHSNRDEFGFEVRL